MNVMFGEQGIELLQSTLQFALNEVLTEWICGHADGLNLISVSRQGGSKCGQEFGASLDLEFECRRHKVRFGQMDERSDGSYTKQLLVRLHIRQRCHD